VKPSETDLNEQYEQRIKVREVLQAYRHLRDHAAALEGYRCFPHPHGYIPSFRYLRGSTWPFGFIVNQKSLLFYIRKAGLSHPAANAKALRQIFAEVVENKRGEIKIRLSSLADAERLTSLLFGQPWNGVPA
jgi:hypothetical protein